MIRGSAGEIKRVLVGVPRKINKKFASILNHNSFALGNKQ